MLNLIPFARPWWIMTYRHVQAGVVGKALQAEFPQACPTAVAPTPVGRHQQRLRLRVFPCPQTLPPLLNARDRELRRIMADPDVHKTFVMQLIVDAVGD